MAERARPRTTPAPVISGLRTQLREMPVVLAGMLLGCLVLGLIGGVVGLVLGLAAYPPTAWFAVLEVGIPAGVVGAILGLFAGVIAQRTGRRPKGATRSEDGTGR
jgi:hypothetical protein